MKRKLFLKALKDSLFLGIKFGLVGSTIGLILHVLWGNLNTVSYTIITGYMIGFFIGFSELFFSHPKAGKFPYSLILLIRTIIYFMITLVCVYSVFRVYLGNTGYTVNVLQDPQTFAEIEKVYYLANINTIYILIVTIIATFIWQLKSFFGKGVLLNYLTGRYHKPSIEDRIFLLFQIW